MDVRQRTCTNGDVFFAGSVLAAGILVLGSLSCDRSVGIDGRTFACVDDSDCGPGHVCHDAGGARGRICLAADRSIGGGDTDAGSIGAGDTDVAQDSVSTADADTTGEPGPKDFTTVFGTPPTDQTTPNGVAVDSEGNLFIVGATKGKLAEKTQPGEMDAFVAKFNAAGNREWVRVIRSPERERMTGIALGTRNRLYVTGKTEGNPAYDESGPIVEKPGGWDVFVAKYRRDGQRDWIDMIGTPEEDVPSDLEAGKDAVVVGETKGNLESSNAGDSDGFVARIDRDSGKPKWISQEGTSETDRFSAVAYDDGHIVVGAESRGQFHDNSHAEMDDAYLVEYHEDEGGIVWSARAFGTGMNDAISTLGLDASNMAIYAGGRTDDGRPSSVLGEFFMDGGEEMWTTTFGGPEQSPPVNGLVIQRNDDLITLVGGTPEPLGGESVRGGFDAYVANFRSSGEWTSTRMFGTEETDEIFGVDLDPAGKLMVGGQTFGPLDGEMHAGSIDLFVKRME